MSSETETDYQGYSLNLKMWDANNVSICFLFNQSLGEEKLILTEKKYFGF